MWTRNAAQFLDALGDHWEFVAKTFANNSYVLGYELINEPFFGDIFAHPSLLLPGEGDRVNLAPTCVRGVRVR